VLEAKTRCWSEVKAKNELEDLTIKAKAAAATKWCKTATQHDGGAKPWTYLLILDDQSRGNFTLDGLYIQYMRLLHPSG
jgi:type III restriction enzyme